MVSGSPLGLLLAPRISVRRGPKQRHPPNIYVDSILAPPRALQASPGLALLNSLLRIVFVGVVVILMWVKL